MIVTLKGLRDRVLRHLDELNETGTTKLLVDEALNYANQQRCTEFPWPFMLWPSRELLTTESGRQTYSLHYEFHRPLYFLNRTTKSYLTEVPWRALPGQDTDWNTDSGHAQHFSISGVDCVQRQPTVVAPLWIQSDSTADVGSTNQIVIKGEDSDGHLRAELLTPLGNARVPTAYSYAKILEITKETEWAGNFTLTDGAGTVLLTLLPTEMGRRYPQLFIHESGAGDVIEYRFYRQPLVLINDYDQPEIPAAHAQILVWDALVQLSGYLTSTQPLTLQVWRDLRLQAQVALYQAYGNEGQSLEAAPSYVRYINDAEAAPRIVTP